jgi:hypothetical protein
MMPRKYIYGDDGTGRIIRIGEIKMGIDGPYIIWYA